MSTTLVADAASDVDVDMDPTMSKVVFGVNMYIDVAGDMAMVTPVHTMLQQWPKGATWAWFTFAGDSLALVYLVKTADNKPGFVLGRVWDPYADGAGDSPLRSGPFAAVDQWYLHPALGLAWHNVDPRGVVPVGFVPISATDVPSGSGNVPLPGQSSSMWPVVPANTLWVSTIAMGALALVAIIIVIVMGALYGQTRAS